MSAPIFDLTEECYSQYLSDSQFAKVIEEHCDETEEKNKETITPDFNSSLLVDKIEMDPNYESQVWNDVGSNNSEKQEDKSITTVSGFESYFLADYKNVVIDCANYKRKYEKISKQNEELMEGNKKLIEMIVFYQRKLIKG